MSKVYDRNEWGYLKDGLEKMGFNDHCVKLVIQCVFSVNIK